MTASFDPAVEPPDTLTDPRELLLAYLDFYRAALLRKLDGMSEEDLRNSRLPSGWTPLALLKHLAFVERRWLRWGFTAEQVDSPWGDEDPDTGKWRVGAEESAQEIRTLFLDECARSREIVAGAGLMQPARGGGRFNPPDHRPALIWILFHLLQEYARHVGQLDVVRELADGVTGE
ncbi:DinB family protein [Streptomyces sp. QL37]|uniref:DinB family protein n=1 Tax=Streptomyces sp. QL37 TaxID=2093747 RepID=UPI000CF2C657|nr:DinB family protein [Streptomyces sp. QL37]PPQ57743.1 Mini-circle protein [Streptomyces sp. QL37]